VIFVHGCFWHRHNCPLFRWPQTRQEFWREKINGNAGRDTEALGRLLDAGWRVGIVWECALKGRSKRPLPEVIDSLSLWLSSDSKQFCVEGQWID
jgi:DNA mismatch endonuclease (patch repair protein)